MPIISPKIPSGLEELMRGLAKSVIKENPQNIYEFAAEYFENLLKERDGSVDQSYKKFATYKVYKKNKTARLKREKESSHDVNADNGFRKDVVAVNYGNQDSFEKKDSSEEKSIEEITLPVTSAPLQALPKSQSSISSESEINASVKKDPSFDVDGVPSKIDNNNDEDEDVKNMVFDDDMAQAALKIQSTFRGHKVRRELKEETTTESDVIQEITTEEVEKEVSEPEIELKESIEHDPETTDNIEEECKNKNMNDEAEVLEASNDENQNDEVSDKIEQNIDSNDVIQTEIDDEIANMVLDDEMEQAALKIQSTFRGHKVRKEVKPRSIQGSIDNPEGPSSNQPNESNMTSSQAEDVDNRSIQAENEESTNDDKAEKLSVDDGVEVEDLVQNEDVVKENDGTTEQEKVEEIEISPEIVAVEVDSQVEENEEVTEAPIDASTNFVVDNEKGDNNDLSDKLEEDKGEPAVTVDDDVIKSPHDTSVGEADETQPGNSDVENLEENRASNELEEIVTEETVEDEETVGEENIEKENEKDSDLPEEKCEVGVQLEKSDKVESTTEELSPEELQKNVNNQSGDSDVILEKESSVVDELLMVDEIPRTEEIEETPINLGDTIELTDNVQSTQSDENAGENEILDDKPSEIEPVEAVVELEEESKNVEVNEEEPQEEFNELPNESETENVDIGAPEGFDDDNVDRIPVVEEICEKKSIQYLEPDQEIDESEKIDFLRKESSSEEVENRDENIEQLSNQEKLPSTEVEYSTLKESISDKGESGDEIDNKSQELTDEKSIDGDETCGSRQNSLDEKVDEIQDEVNEMSSDAVAGETKESLKEVVDDIEINSTQATEELGECEERSNDAVESILQQEISPIELMDEVVNEYAGAVASELFNENVENLDQDLNNSAAAETEEKAEQTIEPQLNVENPLKEIEAPKSIDLSQETVHVSQDEMEPIIDEILQPEKEESEIPEETQVPMDESVPTVAMEEKSPTVEIQETLPKEKDEEKSGPQPSQVEDDVSEMVLDEEMEDAALKIQAAFRGHQVRKEQVIQQNSEQEGKSEENADEKSDEKVSTDIVIDQCSEENQDIHEQEETEHQDTSADVEEIEETEAVDQEETLEETPEEENEAEEEIAVESAENETVEEAGDDPNGTPEDETESAEQPQNNNDDDDVANMVLDEEMEQAALKIQSTFRGHQTRKDIKKDESQGETSSADGTEEPKDPVQDVDDEIANMVLDDEMEQAALKIQSTFRGHKTRKDIKKDDNADEDDNNNEEKPDEKKEEKEEDKPKEEPSQSSSNDKSAKQLQEEEDIANLVMDAEMEQTALKIQSAFRGKARKKIQKDGVESTGSSGEDQSDEDEEDENPAKSEDDPFRQNVQTSQEEASTDEKSYDDEKGSNNSTAHYSQLDDGKYSIERYNTSSDVEPLYLNTSIDDLNLMQGGGIFPEPSGESSDMLTGCSGDDKDPDDRQSTYDKVSSHEIDETINQHEAVDPLNDDDEQAIENFDFAANKDTAEAMYYSLKKNELETRKQLTAEKQLCMSQQPTENEQTMSVETIENVENQSIDKDDEDEDDDDVVIGVQLNQHPTPKRLKYGMSMDDRLLGSILSQDYATKAKKHGFDPLLEATMKNQRFLEKLHEMSKSDDDKEPSYNDYPGDDEDQFDDFYNSNSIRQKMMASSVSIADSDFFDPTNNKSIIDDDKIRTALETIHSSDSESTIASAATKIQAGDGINARRNNNHSMQYSSIGNAAIDKSLDEFIQSQELRIERFDEELEGFNSPPPRKQDSVDEWTDDTATYTDSEKKNMGAGGVIEIKLEQKSSFLTVDERRRTLHREDAIQRNSTREDEDSSKSSNASGEKFNVKENTSKGVEEAIAQQEATTVDIEIHVPILDVTEKSKSSSLTLAKPHRMKRQHTMPVQIQSDTIRLVPKHLRKRIKSAEGDKNKRVSK